MCAAAASRPASRLTSSGNSRWMTPSCKRRRANPSVASGEYGLSRPAFCICWHVVCSPRAARRTTPSNSAGEPDPMVVTTTRSDRSEALGQRSAPNRTGDFAACRSGLTDGCRQPNPNTRGPQRQDSFADPALDAQRLKTPGILASWRRCRSSRSRFGARTDPPAPLRRPDWGMAHLGTGLGRGRAHESATTAAASPEPIEPGRSAAEPAPAEPARPSPRLRQVTLPSSGCRPTSCRQVEWQPGGPSGAPARRRVVRACRADRRGAGRAWPRCAVPMLTGWVDVGCWSLALAPTVSSRRAHSGRTSPVGQRSTLWYSVWPIASGSRGCQILRGP